MGILDDEFTRVVKSTYTLPALMQETVRLIFERRGICLTDSELEVVVEAIENGTECVELPGDSAEQSISISPEDIDQAMLELERNIDDRMEKAVARAVKVLTPSVLGSLYDSLPNALQEWHTAQRAFEKRLRRKWKAGLDRLDMLITMAHEAGDNHVDDLRSELAKEEAVPDALLLEVLFALHSRACRTAREINCLLKAGYADGAQARWRSLHELAVTAFFLAEHRGDTPQRYLDHQAVDRWRAAQEYQQHCKVLGYDPFSDAELAEMQTQLEAAIQKYGKPFKGDYGWAANALGVLRPTFAQIEGALRMSHWRPYFQLACQSIHAGARGVYFSLGLPTEHEDILLSGASDTGLADPGHQMALSLTMVTIAFLTIRPNLDALITCHCLFELCDDISEHLQIAQDSMDD